MAQFWHEYRENWVATLALAVVILIVTAALAAPLITPQDPYDLANLNLRDARRPPGFIGSGGYVHWLGTDAKGRDLFSAILYGLRISLQMGIAAGAVAFCIGTALGIMAANIGGKLEQGIMRLVDLQLSFPAILLALVLVAVLGQGRVPLIIALCTAQSAYFPRHAHRRQKRAPAKGSTLLRAAPHPPGGGPGSPDVLGAGPRSRCVRLGPGVLRLAQAPGE